MSASSVDASNPGRTDSVVGAPSACADATMCGASSANRFASRSFPPRRERLRRAGFSRGSASPSGPNSTSSESAESDNSALVARSSWLESELTSVRGSLRSPRASARFSLRASLRPWLRASPRPSVRPSPRGAFALRSPRALSPRDDSPRALLPREPSPRSPSRPRVSRALSDDATVTSAPYSRDSRRSSGRPSRSARPPREWRGAMSAAGSGADDGTAR